MFSSGINNNGFMVVGCFRPSSIIHTLHQGGREFQPAGDARCPLFEEKYFPGY